MDYAIALPNLYTALSGTDTRSGLVTAIVAALTSVGWTASAIAGGSRMLGVGPQGYSVYADIWDNGSSVSIQLVSTVSAATGYEHHLSVGSGLPWQIACHPCGFAVSRTDTAQNSGGTVVFLGIPRVADHCGLDSAQSITEVWFSFGDWVGDPFHASDTPRNGIDVASLFGQQALSGCINGNTWTAGSANRSQPQILRQSSAHQDTGSADSHPLWYDESDILYPAFIAWGDADDENVVIRGQVYNAAVRSSSTARDALASWDGIDWVNFTDSYYWGSLWLVRSIFLLAIENVAY